MKKYLKERYLNKYKTTNNFNKFFKEQEEIEAFAPNGNVYNVVDTMSEEAHFIMRTKTQYFIEQAFKAMKIDLNDANVAEDLSSGNISTAGRLAKVWCGGSLDDDRELGSGRWSKKPRIASFPNEGEYNKTPITKRVDIVSNCSHHFITFSTLARPDSYAVISYIPEKEVIGISKLQRLADWVGQRFFLQEDLTNMLYKEISEVAKTDSVYVGIFNAVHGCEQFRGAKSKDGAFTSECYGGAFKDPELRKSVKTQG